MESSDALEYGEGAAIIGSRTITDQRFADDINELAGKKNSPKSLIRWIKHQQHGDQCRKDQHGWLDKRCQGARRYARSSHHLKLY